MIGATMLLPSDRYPFVVVKQTKTSYTLRELQCVSSQTGNTPLSFRNGFPVWDHTYSEEDIARLTLWPAKADIVVRKHKDGAYYDAQGIRYSIGVARYYRDYSD